MERASMWAKARATMIINELTGPYVAAHVAGREQITDNQITAVATLCWPVCVR
jgi:hypothetical protein